METPWLKIPLADYEGHMALPEVAQADFLASVFAHQLKELRPRSVAVLGCAGGNGFDRIDASLTKRVVGIDINRDYIEAVAKRFHERFDTLDLYVLDIASASMPPGPVDFVFAGLIFEYVEVSRALANVASLCRPGGQMATVLQLASPATSAVTASRFGSLQALAPIMKLVDPAEFALLASESGFKPISSSKTRLSSGKEFAIDRFEKAAQPRSTAAISTTKGRPPAS
jgi:ubiquinone/menaquinone biosynthesis C-methylase UbiE